MKQPLPERRNKLKSDSLAPAMLSHVELDWLVRILKKIAPVVPEKGMGMCLLKNDAENVSG